jgi:predicted NACHT family NTPase
LLGLPGAGKTTLTSFLTLQFALATLNKAETVIDRQGQSYGATRLPICVRVSEYSRALKQNAALKLGEFLPQPFIKQTGLTHVAALFQQTLAEGNGLVLLDGLDEIIEATERSHIRREIEEFIAAHSVTNAGNRFIITSRIAGYAKASLRSDYTHLTLAPLELAEIERFVNRWCVAVERHASANISDDEAARRAANRRHLARRQR